MVLSPAQRLAIVERRERRFAISASDGLFAA